LAGRKLALSPGLYHRDPAGDPGIISRFEIPIE